MKPTTLKGTAPYPQALQRRCSGPERQALRQEGPSTTTSWIDARGEKRCQGTPALKQTQEYPAGFGAVHGQRFLECYAQRYPEVMFRQHLADLHEAGAPAGAQMAPAGASAPAGAEMAPKRRRLSIGSADALVDLCKFGLPIAVQEALQDGWFLRDFLRQEPWANGYRDERTVEDSRAAAASSSSGV